MISKVGVLDLVWVWFNLQKSLLHFCYVWEEKERAAVGFSP